MTIVVSGNETTGRAITSDDLFITATGSIIPTNQSTAITVSTSNAAGSSVSIFGTVGVRNSGTGIYVYSGNVAIEIGQTGSIIARNAGFQGDGISSFSSGTVVNLTNSGLISASDFGLYLSGQDNVITNTKSGTIIGGSDGTSTTTYAFAAALLLQGQNAELRNAGTIIGEEHPLSGRSMAVVNAFPDSDPSFSFNPETELDFSFTNSGDVFGEVFLAGGKDTLKNSGYISDRVHLGPGADVYDGRGDGVVDDKILLGDGQDRADGGDSRDEIDGGNGNDTINGRDGDDSLIGRSGEDNLRGGNGEDSLTGGSNSDKLNGGADGDDLNGGAGSDILRGNSGDDELRGSDGGDALYGGSGDDTLRGDGGKDTLKGGSGNDVFVFSKASDSPNSSGRDEISDFTVDADLIDLSGFNGDLIFIGSDSFSGDEREVRVTTSSSGDVTVRIDSNADGTTDSRIVLRNVDGTLDAGDFIL